MKAIVLDLDGTLINSAIDFKKMKTHIITYVEGIGVTQGFLNPNMLNFEITNSSIKCLKQKGLSRQEIKSVQNRITEIMNQVELESLNKATLIEDTPETLKALRELELKLGIITRSCHEYAEKILAIFGLSEYIDAVVSRDDVTNPKPNPEHALLLLRLLGVSADQAIFVGDHWSDAECARKAGLKFILVKNQGQDTQSLGPFEFQITNRLIDIIKIVESINN